MRSAFVIVILLGTLAVSGSAAVNAQQISDPVTTVPGGVPIGHLQPRVQPFSPQSPAEQAEQQQMSTFDARQQKQDEELDKRLNICRGCRCALGETVCSRLSGLRLRVQVLRWINQPFL